MGGHGSGAKRGEQYTSLLAMAEERKGEWVLVEKQSYPRMKAIQKWAHDSWGKAHRVTATIRRGVLYLGIDANHAEIPRQIKRARRKNA